ncbi:Receptor-type tyrosine-protein phosphatase S [Wickerhamomyces ciferrii]|uniref:protein-tyrosine-phosphatase n=1 Tax=Wickerhamomyces ciferrii (strain ATCC 14091 / BCRC 22168 / CBS 111 / JCM 3599 / NBRC 0793 / NRRL Y-1031 F-60-10) TaxID=1206466 RepID=K0KYI4_WICCF|nr:Receptor-type tyrosine-protein phosphatase S [Wickerhamomyces ciferrii]CCH47137.1 Receptor-type tyrosine-protein phosphatase S [Wickerhamomyces ciferrii]
MTSLRSPLEQSSGFIFPETSSPNSRNSRDSINSSPKSNNNKHGHSHSQSHIYTINPNESNYFISNSRFPTLSQINTIDENLVGNYNNNNQNQFEKSFNNLNLKKINSRDTINSDSTLIDSLHNKNDSINSINSTDTLNSFRLKRFNSSSSVPQSNTSEFNFSYSNHSPSGSISGISSSPSYSINSINSVNSGNNNNQFKKIVKFPKPENLNIMNNTELSLIIEGMTSEEIDSILILDVRPFIEYNLKHIKNSINFNLPSTLLKRTNFTLSRCLNNLSIMENVKINKFLNNQSTMKKIIIYDDLIMNDNNDEVSLATYGTSMKFFNDLNFKGEIYVLKNGFQKFQLEFNDLTEATTNTAPTSQFKPPHNRSLSLANVSSSSLSSPISPNLSRFQLPKLPKTPVFKIRHNEEFYDFDNYKIINEFKFLNQFINEPDTDDVSIPNWLKILLNKNNYISLFEKFKNLEIEEKKRINNLIQTNSVTSGIELGFKNRYKDIFPYEHSRVKLTKTPTYESYNNDYEFNNYINANYINCPSNLSNLKYIATQAPLLETTQDFTKLIKDNNVPLIISLTNQFENGVEKCYSYWNDLKNFKILQEEKIENTFIIRRLWLQKYKFEILQIQILNWSDFDILLENQQIDILKLIYLKKFILEKLDKTFENVIVHCSAGCGRTGTFCTLDSIINSNINNQQENNFEFDPIFQIVEIFRNQRISMVQNLRQYLFIYDCLLNFFKNFNNFNEDNGNNNGNNDIFIKLQDLKILNNFLNQNTQE